MIRYLNVMLLVFLLCSCKEEEITIDQIKDLTENEVDFSTQYSWENIVGDATDDGAYFSSYQDREEFNETPIVYDFVFDMEYRHVEMGVRNGRPEPNCYATLNELKEMFPNLKLYKTSLKRTKDNELRDLFITWINGSRGDIYVSRFAIYTDYGEFVPNRYISRSMKQINCGSKGSKK